ncbi:MAG TPA: TlpA disulfide reductase family protein, partial [Mucilaginibacter sp.]|nr:TlpA disulfide reductase family protein [Mucilaginibacter sp.]
LAYQMGSTRVLDSTQIVNGNFQFKGDLIYPSLAVLVMDYSGISAQKLSVDSADKFVFYIDKGTINITSPDSAYKAKITGSRINDEYRQLQAINSTASAKTTMLMANALKDTTKDEETRHNEMQANLKVIQAQYHQALKDLVKQYPDSYLSLLTLGTIGGPTPDPDEILGLLDSLSEDVRNTETARILKDELEKLKTISIGAIAPDFEQADTSGHMVRLSSFRGKYVLLDFWASWCQPCREENPNLVKVYNEYKNKNFTIVGVSLDRQDGTFNWLNAIRMDHLTWTQLSDLKFWNNAVAQLYFVQSIPKNFLIDPSGKIIAQDLRGDDLENELAKVLGK